MKREVGIFRKLEYALEYLEILDIPNLAAWVEKV
jgi:hypothetical protein